MTGRVQAIAGFLRRFAVASHGNVAMIFALMLPVLAILTLGGIDISRATTVRSHLQDALDAASLAAARSPYITDAELTEVGLRSLRANMPEYFGADSGDTATFTLSPDRVVIADATVNIRTMVANIILPPYGRMLDDTLPVGVRSQVTRSPNIEVSLVLDITGSMAGSRLTDLKAAARDLVETVIKADQEARAIPGVPRMRMALVPYSMGVNPGDYAVAVRGSIRGATDISGIAWSPTTTTRSIAGVTRGSATTITSSGHGYQNGDTVWISGVGGATWINAKAYVVAASTANTFQIRRNGADVNSASAAQWTSGGTIRLCTVGSCELVVTSTNHGLADNERVAMSNIMGLTSLNAVVDSRNNYAVTGIFGVRRVTADTFSLIGVVGPNQTQTYASANNDVVQCVEIGCQSYVFTNTQGTPTLRAVSNCVSERTGVDAYKETAPGDARVGLTYPGSDNGCLGSTITPLTVDRATLNAQINGYRAVGSTAGQIGVGWGWYMVSPIFGSIFPVDNRPAAYNLKDVVKVVIIMTDGEFNTTYCNSVVTGSLSGSGEAKQHTRCDPGAAYNGNPFEQAVTMCSAMKAPGRDIVIYTVGFDISTSTGAAGKPDTAMDVMKACATDDAHMFLPKTGASLKSDFATIGSEISRLRISK